MEDPWSNAWSEPETRKTTYEETDTRQGASWTVDAQASASHEAETVDDVIATKLTTPTWHTEGDTAWPQEPSKYWTGTSAIAPLDGWRINGVAPDEDTTDESDERDEPSTFSATVDDQEEADVIAENVSEGDPIEHELSDVATEEKDTSASRPISPLEDVIPSKFATQVELDEEPNDRETSWGRSLPPPVNGDGQPWGEDVWQSSQKKDEEEVEDDEWAIAQQEQQRRNKKVPPELLVAILQDWSDLTSELYPSDVTNGDESQIQSWMAELELPGCAPQLMPRSSFQPPINFCKTTVAQRMADSVRQSKDLPIMKLSPMTQFFVAKPVSKLRKTLRTRKLEVSQESIAEDGPELQPSISTKSEVREKPASSGIWSFWNRQSSSSASLTQPSASNEIAAVETLGNPQPNAEAPMNDIWASSPVHASAAGLSTKNSSRIASPVPSLTTDTKASRIGGDTNEMISPTSVAGPSVVSRFFNRFSRSSAPNSHASSPRNSIALSSDDVDFLSDLVPSAHDDMDDMDAFVALVGAPKPSSSMQPRSAANIPCLPPPTIPILPPPTSSPSLSRSSTPLSLGGNTLNRTPPLIPPPSNFATSRARTSFVPRMSQAQPKQSSTISRLPPPITAPSNIATSSVKAMNIFDDDDDFTSFQSSSLAPLGNSRSAVLEDSFADTSSHELISQKGADADISFGDFETSHEDFLRTPSPPAVPKKPSPLLPPSLTLPLPVTPTVQPSVLAARRSSRTANHLSTMSLLEKAAARPGRWPAPPSPHINPLAPPPPPHKVTNGPTNADFFDSIEKASLPLTNAPSSLVDMVRPGLDSMLVASQSSYTLAPPPAPASFLSSPLLQKPSASASAPSLSASKPVLPQSKTSVDLLTPATNNFKPGPKLGGREGALSAQDLSFFEGL